MSQSEAAKLYGNWNALFLGPNPRIIKDLAPLLSRCLPTLTTKECNNYPSSRHQITDLLGSPEINLCFLDVASDLEKALALLPELLKQDAKLPVIAVLPGNDSNLVLRCLRQGATDFLLQPFTDDQVEAALQKISRSQPARGGKAPGKVYC